MNSAGLSAPTGGGAERVRCTPTAVHAREIPNQMPPETRYRQSQGPWADSCHRLRFVRLQQRPFCASLQEQWPHRRRRGATSWRCVARKCGTLRGLPSRRRCSYHALWNSRPRCRSNVPHNRGYLARCFPLRARSGRAPTTEARDWDIQQRLRLLRGPPPLGWLHSEDIYFVIMQSMQCCSCG